MSSIGIAHFSFNIICRVKATSKQKKNFEKTILEFKQYKPGRPSNPATGFTLLDISDEDEENETLKAIQDQTISIRHVYESYEKVKGFFGSGSEEETVGTTRRTHTTDIHWIMPDILAIAGPASDVFESLEWFRQKSEVKSEIIRFDPKFLMWIVYKHRSSNPKLTSSLEVDFISDATTEGSFDKMGKKTTVQDCPDVSQAIQTIVTILAGKELSMLLCGLTLDGIWRITMSIDDSGKARFYASKGTMKSSNQKERIRIALLGLREIVKAYEHWCIMPNLEKYPPGDFFSDLAALAVREGHHIYGPAVQNLIKRYESLRLGG